MEFVICNENKNANISLEQLWQGDILFVTANMQMDQVQIPESFRICWKITDKGCYSVWSPDVRQASRDL